MQIHQHPGAFPCHLSGIFRFHDPLLMRCENTSDIHRQQSRTRTPLFTRRQSQFARRLNHLIIGQSRRKDLNPPRLPAYLIRTGFWKARWVVEGVHALDTERRAKRDRCFRGRRSESQHEPVGRIEHRASRIGHHGINQRPLILPTRSYILPCVFHMSWPNCIMHNNPSPCWIWILRDRLINCSTSNARSESSISTE